MLIRDLSHGQLGYKISIWFLIRSSFIMCFGKYFMFTFFFFAKGYFMFTLYHYSFVPHAQVLGITRWMHEYISVDSGASLTLIFLNSLAVPHYWRSRQDIGSKLWGWIEADYQDPTKGIYNLFCFSSYLPLSCTSLWNCNGGVFKLLCPDQKTPSKKDFNN